MNKSLIDLTTDNRLVGEKIQEAINSIPDSERTIQKMVDVLLSGKAAIIRSGKVESEAGTHCYLLHYHDNSYMKLTMSDRDLFVMWEIGCMKKDEGGLLQNVELSSGEYTT